MGRKQWFETFSVARVHGGGGGGDGVKDGSGDGNDGGLGQQWFGHICIMCSSKAPVTGRDRCNENGVEGECGG